MAIQPGGVKENIVCVQRSDVLGHLNMSAAGRIVKKILATQGLMLIRTEPVNVPITSPTIPPPSSQRGPWRTFI